MLSIALYIFLILGIASAIYAVSTASVIRAIFSMFASFFSVSAILVFASAEFLAISHLMIYVGGIIVVMVFGIMLSNKDFQSDVLEKKEESNKNALKYTKLATAIACIFLFFLLAQQILSNDNFQTSSVNKTNDVKTLGITLFSEYTLAFEIISIVLLIALIGVSLIHRKEEVSNAN